MADKYCVFCGNKPVNKTKEHILPKWLIEITGPKNRLARFPSLNDASQEYSFSNFVFPACETCNVKYGILESESKPIIEKMLNNSVLSANEIEVLLDWVDKIRIGLWLSMCIRDKNIYNLEPNFYIQGRIGTKDRAIFISKTNLHRKLDCAVIQTIHAFNEDQSQLEYDSVRGVFVEGDKLYPNSGFNERNHIQLCIRNPNCIKGYFHPRKMNDAFPSP